MGMRRNGEFVREAAIYIAICAVFSIAGFIISAAAGVLTLLMGLSVITVFLIFSRRRCRRMAGLSDELGRILHGEESYDLERFSEGELSILESELSKLLVTLRQQSDNLKADKVFLADALADISHQLKTPLTSINLAVAMLSSPELTDERRMELTRDVERSLTRLEWLVSSLLKMSHLDAGMAELRRDRVEAAQVVRLAVAPLAIPLEVRGVELRCEIGDESFKGDAAWTAEAIGNILKNSMEHTPPHGRITISSSENAIFTEITVRDTGAGIDSGDLPHLFERFYRGKNASGQSAGIGLALSRAIITAQGGSITAGKARDGGAEFTIRFYKSAV